MCVCVATAGVRPDPAGGPGPEGDPPEGSERRILLGEHAAGGDLHPPDQARPGSALDRLAPPGSDRLRLRPLTDGVSFQNKSYCRFEDCGSFLSRTFEMTSCQFEAGLQLWICCS